MKRLTALAITTVIVGSGLYVATTSASTPRHDPIVPTLHPQVHWARGTKPLSDSRAAALVTPEPEVRPGNVPYNDYTPTKAEIRKFLATQDHTAPFGHRIPPKKNSLFAYVTGNSHLVNPSTDMLIQWASHKWGIPEDTFRAIAQQETWWAQDDPGDPERVSSSWVGKYPAQARINRTHVFESMGIMQIKWRPDQSKGTGTEPLRWRSTAFNLDYAGAMLRFYYDGFCKCGRGYKRGQAWQSIGAYNQPLPWNNAKAQQYVGRIKLRLRDHLWTSPWF